MSEQPPPADGRRVGESAPGMTAWGPRVGPEAPPEPEAHRKVRFSPLVVAGVVAAVTVVVVVARGPISRLIGSDGSSGHSGVGTSVPGIAVRGTPAGPSAPATGGPVGAAPVPTHAPRNPFRPLAAPAQPRPSTAVAAQPPASVAAQPPASPASGGSTSGSSSGSSSAPPVVAAPPVHPVAPSSAPSAPTRHTSSSAATDALTESTGDGCDGGLGWRTRRVAHARAAADFPLAHLGWRLSVQPARVGVMSIGDTATRTISVFVRPCSVESNQTLLRAIAYQVGQVIDIEHGSADVHARWLAARGAPAGTVWMNRAAPFASGADDFAEAYARWVAGVGDWRSQVAPAPTGPQLTKLAREFFTV